MRHDSRARQRRAPPHRQFPPAASEVVVRRLYRPIGPVVSSYIHRLMPNPAQRPSGISVVVRSEGGDGKHAPGFAGPAMGAEDRSNPSSYSGAWSRSIMPIVNSSIDL